MSDALNYLVKARPDAVGHYFAFLKACGTQLDPKTRNLISVISKVHAQTERGLRQYLGRALREGEQVVIGGNETYVSLCRRHWREAVGDREAKNFT